MVAINKNPETKVTDPWTQSTVFYYTRKLMKDLGIEDRSRKHITNSIRIVCDRLKTTREELGIYAADRAQLYFKGQWHSVGYNEIGNLMKKGTDLIIVEKEGAALLLGQYADQSGIAFLNTRGFLTEYATAVSVLAKKHGANVVILTDLDSSGLLIRYAVPNVPRVGIDFETLEILGIDQTDVDEEYDPGKHITKLEFNAEQDEELEPTLSRLKEKGKYKRIEIDTVIAAAGNEIFWNFLKSKLEELFPNRDYNRAIQVPEYVMPTEVEDLIAKLENKGVEVAENEHSKIKDELKNIEGFIDNITEKEVEISDRIKKTISESKEIGPILPEITKLIEKYDFLK